MLQTPSPLQRPSAEGEGAHSSPTPSARLRSLAHFIEERKDWHFAMSSYEHCAYAYAQELFGWVTPLSNEGGNPGVLAKHLGIPFDVANGIYVSGDWSRNTTVHELRRLADNCERAEGYERNVYEEGAAAALSQGEEVSEEQYENV